MNTTVVGLSGGTDSAVAALLLKEARHTVIGVTLKLHGSPQEDAHIRDAARVAGALNISHHVHDLEKRFKSRVITPFLDALAASETPSPCLGCNPGIKMAGLVEAATMFGAETIATGHYAARRDLPEGAALFRGRDPGRDQSYYLSRITPEHLARLLLPLEALSKPEVRARAEAANLPVAQKAESQDLCFTDKSPGDFLAAHRPSACPAGPVVSPEGDPLGHHRGLAHYTEGQRRGLGIGGGPPRYVIRRDPDTNRIIAGEKKDLATREVYVRDLSWLLPVPPEDGRSVLVQFRARQKAVKARLFSTPSGLRVVPETPAEGIAPGQGAAFYEKDRLLGGGWIARPPANPAE